MSIEEIQAQLRDEANTITVPLALFSNLFVFAESTVPDLDYETQAEYDLCKSLVDEAKERLRKAGYGKWVDTDPYKRPSLLEGGAN